MNISKPSTTVPAWMRGPLAMLLVAMVQAAPALGEVDPMDHAARRPAAEAFAPGPRVSEGRAYTVTLQPQQPLRLRRLQSVPLLITDAQGQLVDDAVISVDGGMPEHGHGLPTQPRVRRAEAAGRYEIEGLRFSMGGWWQLRLRIDSPAGDDLVIFNLDL